MADQDSENSTETQTATPDESRPRFGSGLTQSDPSPSPSPAVGGPSEDANPETPVPQERDWDKIDLERVNPDELPDHLKPAAQLARRLKADYTRKTQDLAEQRRREAAETAERERRYLEAIGRTQQAPSSAQDQLDALQRLAADPSLSPEDRRGLEVVDQLIRGRVEPLTSENEQLKGNLQKMEQFIASIQQERQVQRERALLEDQRAAEEVFGAEEVSTYLSDPAYAQLIANNYGRINPRTGQPFNLTALLEVFTGRQAEQIAAARAGQQQARQQAKETVRPKGGVPRGDHASGAISRREAEAQVAKIFG